MRITLVFVCCLVPCLFAGCGSGTRGDVPDLDASTGQEPDSAVAAAPVYVYLFDHTEDHINVGDGAELGLCEERWYRLIELLETLRSEYPNAALDGGPWANLQFHGSEAESIRDRNEQTAAAAGANGTGLADRLRGAIADSLIDIGYHGAHEPTYTSNVFTDIDISTLSWSERQDLAEQFLTCWRHPLLGVDGPDTCRADDAGGILEVLRVLLGGDAQGMTVVTGLRGTANLPSGSFLLDEYAPGALGFGFSDHAGGGGGSAVQLSQEFYDSVEPLLKELVDGVDNVYGLHHVAGVVSTSMLGDRTRGFGRFDPQQGLEELRRRIAQLPTGTPQLAKFHLFTKGLYAKGCGPTNYAYENPDSPKLPPECLHDADTQEQYWTDLEAQLRYLIEEVFVERPGSAFVTPTTIAAHAVPGFGFDVSGSELRAAADQLLASDTLPLYVVADQTPLALGELFQLFAEALAGYETAGTLPDSVLVARLRGAVRFRPDEGSARQLTGAQVVATAGALAARYALDPSNPQALFSPPAFVRVNGDQVATSGALRAMAGTYAELFDSGQLPESVDATASPVENEDAYAEAVPGGMLWAYKPVVWK